MKGVRNFYFWAYRVSEMFHTSMSIYVARSFLGGFFVVCGEVGRTTTSEHSHPGWADRECCELGEKCPLDGLQQAALETDVQGVCHIADLMDAGDHDELDRWESWVGKDGLGQLFTIHVRHHVVADDDVIGRAALMGCF